jgi:ATP synthase protein I
MDDEKTPNDATGETEFRRQVAAQAARKRRARRNPTPGVWFGLGMTGLIGWSVVVPTLLGAALGLWLDRRYPAAHSWTLALLVAGLVLGCFNAWHWVTKEDKAMRDEQADPHE